jgi:hypothetical protein
MTELALLEGSHLLDFLIIPHFGAHGTTMLIITL